MDNEAESSLEQISIKEGIRLKEYLDDIAISDSSETTDDKRRVFCCNSSRCFYCPECCKVLIEKEAWPNCYTKLRLPFTIDLVLGWKERRTSSSGIHIMAIQTMMNEILCGKRSDLKCPDDKNGWWRDMRLFDRNRGDALPAYSPDSTFVLFPQKGRSVPISQVARKLNRLVVLDVKWTRSGIVQLDPNLAKLQTVHLEHSPKQSHFWRWHQKGDGMLSTMEAIYFATIEVAVAKGWPAEDRERMIHIMWLFALQRRAIIRQQQRTAARPLPFSVEGKDQQRNVRIRKRNDPSDIIDPATEKEERIAEAFSNTSLS